MNAITVAVPDDLQHWVDVRLSEGVYLDAADYIRDLLKQDRAHAADRDRLRTMIREGLASGVIDRDGEDVIADIIAEDPDLRA